MTKENNFIDDPKSIIKDVLLNSNLKNKTKEELINMRKNIKYDFMSFLQNYDSIYEKIFDFYIVDNKGFSILLSRDMKYNEFIVNYYSLLINKDTKVIDYNLIDKKLVLTYFPDKMMIQVESF